MYNPETANAVCELVSEGMSANKACKEIGVKLPTFLLWCSEHADLAEKYARARATGADLEFEALEELQNQEPPVIDGKVDQGWVAWRRLQVDTRKWSLSKKQPRKYGDKLDLNHGGSIEFGRIECVVVDPKD